jgi:hypothetical protein
VTLTPGRRARLHRRGRSIKIAIDRTGFRLEFDRGSESDSPPGSDADYPSSSRTRKWMQLCTTMIKVVAGVIGVAAAAVTLWIFIRS